MHQFLNDRPWFAPKRFGLGAGMPIAWQGWVLLASYLGVTGGLVAMLGDSTPPPLWWVGLGTPTLVFIIICWKKTDGGWKWRWGEEA
jgi:hypothetical protein